MFRLKRRALVFLRENSEDFEGHAFRKCPSNLEGADLEGANLEDANLERADLKGAYTRSANIENTHTLDANLTNTQLYLYSI
ncbi:pentapeptide repeat-containing protein [Cylindrospermopsis raciborskii G7]|uniref:pentapeptide repeat-containing protein n=2 Tax=Cylindrospermopsis raciborskii TaxID=77022 RepID=UPI003EBC70F8